MCIVQFSLPLSDYDYDTVPWRGGGRILVVPHPSILGSVKLPSLTVS